MPSAFAAALTSPSGTSQRFAVPDAQADALWRFLSRQYKPEHLQKLYPNYSSHTARHQFTDVYLDDAEKSLLQNQAAVLLRQPQAGNAQPQVAVQLPKKLSDQPVRQFTLQGSLQNVSENWLPALAPEQQKIVKNALRNFGLSQAELETSLEIQQNLRQIRIFQGNEILLVLTHQTVSTQKPAVSFTEFDIIQVAPTKAAADLKADILAQVQTRFPLIKPETKSQYGKMAAMHAERPQLLVSSTVGWLGLALLFSSMSMLVLRRHRKRHV